MDPATIQAATLLPYLIKVSAPSMVRTGSAQRMGASPMQGEGKRSVSNIILTKCLAQLKAAATLLMHEGFVERTMLERNFALLTGVIQLLKLVDSA